MKIIISSSTLFILSLLYNMLFDLKGRRYISNIYIIICCIFFCFIILMHELQTSFIQIPEIIINNLRIMIYYQGKGILFIVISGFCILEYDFINYVRFTSYLLLLQGYVANLQCLISVAIRKRMYRIK
jgi:hypothetical protein